MKIRAQLILNTALIVLFYGLRWWAEKFPEQLNTWYSYGVYPFFFKMRSTFFNQFPFSIGDLIYGIAIVAFFYFINSLRTKNKTKAILQCITGVFLLLFWFQISWGLNYYRKPILDERESNLYTEDNLIKVTHLFAENSSRLHFQLSKSDSLPVVLTGNKKEIIKKVGKVKISLFSYPLSFMGFSGYLNPFTLEAQINGRIPKINLPLTTAHEIAHQKGYAAENEANFIGFLDCFEHPDPEIQYAAALFGLRYSYNELYKVNPKVARKILCHLYPGILANFRITSSFWEAHKNPLEPLFKQSYDGYLKANNQKKGIQSYNAVVGLLIAHFKVNNKDLAIEK